MLPVRRGRAIEKPYLIETTDFRTDETNVIELDVRERGHGGGDSAFVRDFRRAIFTARPFPQRWSSRWNPMPCAAGRGIPKGKRGGERRFPMDAEACDPWQMKN